MCGFFGFTGKDNGAGEPMLKVMAHRGPDDGRLWSDGGLTLGFRRLSVIGIDDPCPPLFNEDQSLALVFNGEVYNYEELRERLTALGHRFATGTDAEAVLHGYEEYGDGLFRYLRGMFAFALCNLRARTLFCARDPFGIKPFYYARHEGRLLFASEIKSLLQFPGFPRNLNENALAEYLTFQYSVLPETFFTGVFKLPPGHILTCSYGAGGAVKTERYFTPVFAPARLSLEAAENAVDHAVRDSVRAHMVADVEVGSFLSGGVDSGYVAACAAQAAADAGGRLKTFTVGFDYERYSEIGFAQTLSERLGIENRHKVISTEEYWDALSDVQYHMDEPLADPSAVALYFVSREAARHVKVALSGEGADELFGGYNIYREPMDLRVLTVLPRGLRRFLKRAASFIPFNVKGRSFFIRGGTDLRERYVGGAKIFTAEERKRLLADGVGKDAPDPADITRPYYDAVADADAVTQMQYLDLHLWMVGDILLKADRMSMAHGLEVRVPLLDKEVFRVAARLPVHFRVNRAGTKYVFRRAAKRHIPEETAARRKLGFPVPIRIWLREERYAAKVRAAFASPAARRFFKEKELTALLEAHKSGKRDNSRRIWTVYMFLLWYERYFGGGAQG